MSEGEGGRDENAQMQQTNGMLWKNHVQYKCCKRKHQMKRKQEAMHGTENQQGNHTERKRYYAQNECQATQRLFKTQCQAKSQAGVLVVAMFAVTRLTSQNAGTVKSTTMRDE